MSLCAHKNWPLFNIYSLHLQSLPEREYISSVQALISYWKVTETAELTNIMKSSIRIVDVDRLETWSKYKAGMCDSCAANCCTMPLEVQLSDLVRLELVDQFEVDNVDHKQIAKRLMKMRLIDHYNPKHNIFTMARRAGGDCNFLDKNTRRCTVYEKRPETCRQHPKKGPKPGFCAYGNKALS